MSRRVSLPAADDLFRKTSEEPAAPVPSTPSVRAVPDHDGDDRDDRADRADRADREPARSGRRRPSGRVRHDEKMTVYVTSDELLHLEQARLALRAQHGLAVDRGRLVREALALVLADFEEHGEDSVLVHRLTEE